MKLNSFMMRISLLTANLQIRPIKMHTDAKYRVYYISESIVITREIIDIDLLDSFLLALIYFNPSMDK